MADKVTDLLVEATPWLDTAARIVQCSIHLFRSGDYEPASR